MTPALERAAQACVEAAIAPAVPPVEQVVEALAYLAALHCLAAPAALKPRARKALRARGSSAALALEGAAAEDEAPFERALLAGASRAGLEVLRGEAPTRLERLAAPLRPTARRVDALLRGELDGFAALACAARLLLDGEVEALADLAAVARDAAPGAGAADAMAAPASEFRLAAAAPASVRPPGEGRSVGHRANLEAVLFLGPGGERLLALYSDLDQPLRVEAPGLVEEDARRGYWLGRLAPGASALDLRVQLGDTALRWRLDLPPGGAG